MADRTALFTVVDSDFCLGAEVMLHSFFRHNPGFSGDVLVLDAGLGEEEVGRLSFGGRTRFLAPDPRIVEAAEAVAERNHHFRGATARFLGLQLYAVSGYERVVSIDGDVVCVGDCSDLFRPGHPLRAVPDLQHYRKENRDPLTYLAIPDAGVAGPEAWRRRALNAGVVSVGGELLDGRTFAALLDRMARIDWEAMGAHRITDQRVVNEHFRGEYEMLSAAYNYQPWMERLIWLDEGIDIFDARLIHFSWKRKPWTAQDACQLARDLPTYAKSLELWHEAYRRLCWERRGRPGLEVARYHEAETRTQIGLLLRGHPEVKPRPARRKNAREIAAEQTIKSLQARLRQEQERSLRAEAKLEAASRARSSSRAEPKPLLGLFKPARREVPPPTASQLPVRTFRVFLLAAPTSPMLPDWLSYHLSLFGRGRIHVLADPADDRTANTLARHAGKIELEYLPSAAADQPCPEWALARSMKRQAHEADLLLALRPHEFVAARVARGFSCRAAEVAAALGRLDPALAGRFRFSGILRCLPEAAAPADPMLAASRFAVVSDGNQAGCADHAVPGIYSSGQFRVPLADSREPWTRRAETGEADLALFVFPSPTDSAGAVAGSAICGGAVETRVLAKAIAKLRAKG